MKGQRVLGKGLSALIQGADTGSRLGDKEVRLVPLAMIGTNPRQPRKLFNSNTLHELAESIGQVGVLQPILVRRLRPAEEQQLSAVPPGPETPADELLAPPRYRLVAGERRLRAARLAGIDEIPAIVCTYKETEALKVALLENIQREDLNPIEEASAYQELLAEYGATQEELAAMLGKTRSSVANAMRLLSLEPKIQTMLETGEISRGHAKALLSLSDSTARLRLARLCRRRGLSVRECERRVNLAQQGGRPRRRRRAAVSEIPAVRALRERAERALGAPVRIERDAKSGKGALTIRFFSDADLERLLEIMGVDTDLT